MNQIHICACVYSYERVTTRRWVKSTSVCVSMGTRVSDVSYWRRRWIPSMGWLRWVGSLKLQISFAKEPYKRDYTLQKRPIILRRLLIIATPYFCGFLWIWACVCMVIHTHISNGLHQAVDNESMNRLVFIMSDNLVSRMYNLTIHCLFCIDWELIVSSISSLIPDDLLSLMYQLTMNGLFCIISDDALSLMYQLTAHCLSYIMSDIRQFIVSNNWQWIVSYLSYLITSCLLCVNWQ